MAAFKEIQSLCLQPFRSVHDLKHVSIEGDIDYKLRALALQDLLSHCDESAM